MPPENDDLATLDRGNELDTPAVEEKKVETAVVDEPAAVEKKDEAVADKPRDADGKFIPVSRHKDVLQKEREARELAERKLADIQASLKQVDRSADAAKLESEIQALETAHAKALIDGDAEKAAATMGQIRLKERQIAIAESSTMTARAKDEAREEIRVDLAIEQLETTYPVLNKDAEEFDQDVVDEVLGWQQVYIAKGMNAAQALLKAAQKVVVKAEVAAPAAEKKGLAAGATERAKAQIDKNLETARKQPPSLKDAGIDSDKAGIQGDVDVSKLTYEEFSALPAATKARLRGDLV